MVSTRCEPLLPARPGRIDSAAGGGIVDAYSQAHRIPQDLDLGIGQPAGAATLHQTRGAVTVGMPGEADRIADCDGGGQRALYPVLGLPWGKVADIALSCLIVVFYVNSYL